MEDEYKLIKEKFELQARNEVYHRKLAGSFHGQAYGSHASYLTYPLTGLIDPRILSLTYDYRRFLSLCFADLN